MIAPALRTGWYGDDAFYWALPGTLAAAHESAPTAIGHAVTAWLVGNARLYPGLVVEKYLVFTTVTDLFAYKLLLVAATLAVVEVFRRTVGAYAGRAVGNLAALVACGCLQERGYQDAILAYNAMPQVVTLALLVSVWAFAGQLAGRRGARLLGIAAYLVAALTYEAAYAFGLVHLTLAKVGGRTWAGALRAAWPFLAIGALLIVLALALHRIVSPHGPYALSFAPLALARTAFEQIVAAVPLLYWAADPNGIFGRANPADFYHNAPLDPLVVLAFALATWLALRRLGDRAVRPGALAMVGALVVVLPALPVAVLVKYQHELRLGWGYLPVFVEYFGVALLIVALLSVLPAVRTRAAATVACALALAFVAGMTQATNVRVVRELQPERDAELALQTALQYGLLRGVHDGAIVTVPRAAWIAYDGQGPDGISSAGLAYAYARVRVRLLPPGPNADVALDYDARTHVWQARRLH